MWNLQAETKNIFTEHNLSKVSSVIPVTFKIQIPHTSQHSFLSNYRVQFYFTYKWNSTQK